MKKVHWDIYTEEIENIFYIFPFRVKSSIYLSYDNMMIFFSWGQEHFGSVFSYGCADNKLLWAYTASKDIFYFKKKEDLMLFLLTWQDTILE